MWQRSGIEYSRIYLVIIPSLREHGGRRSQSANSYEKSVHRSHGSHVSNCSYYGKYIAQQLEGPASRIVRAASLSRLVGTTGKRNTVSESAATQEPSVQIHSSWVRRVLGPIEPESGILERSTSRGQVDPGVARRWNNVEESWSDSQRGRDARPGVRGVTSS